MAIGTTNATERGVGQGEEEWGSFVRGALARPAPGADPGEGCIHRKIRRRPDGGVTPETVIEATGVDRR